MSNQILLGGLSGLVGGALYGAIGAGVGEKAAYSTSTVQGVYFS